ncbi:MAG: hypothetical protein M1371_11130 [Actinobacteria bacterium]|nr:hypothetical protein [Actinomycetota bacterium]
MHILKIFTNSFRYQFWILSRPAVYVILVIFFVPELIVLRALGFYPGPDYFAGAFLPPPIAQFKSLAILAVTNTSGFTYSRYGTAIAVALIFSVLFNSLLAAIFQISCLPINNEAIRGDRISVCGKFIKQVVVNFLYILAIFIVSGSIYFGAVALSITLATAELVPVFAGAILSTLALFVILILSHVPLAAALTFRSMSTNKLLRILRKCWLKLLVFSSMYVVAVVISKTLLVNAICSPINFASAIWLRWVMFFAATFLLLLLSTTQNFFGFLFSRGIIQASFE